MGCRSWNLRPKSKFVLGGLTLWRLTCQARGGRTAEGLPVRSQRFPDNVRSVRPRSRRKLTWVWNYSPGLRTLRSERWSPERVSQSESGGEPSYPWPTSRFGVESGFDSVLACERLPGRSRASLLPDWALNFLKSVRFCQNPGSLKILVVPLKFSGVGLEISEVFQVLVKIHGFWVRGGSRLVQNEGVSGLFRVRRGPSWDPHLPRSSCKISLESFGFHHFWLFFLDFWVLARSREVLGFKTVFSLGLSSGPARLYRVSFRTSKFHCFFSIFGHFWGFRAGFWRGFFGHGG